MISKNILENILIDPSVYLKTGKEISLNLVGNFYQTEKNDFKYPIINGIPILKLPHDQESDTSYDDIIPSFGLGNRDTDTILKVNSLNINDIRDKTVLLAGTGGGGDIIWLKKLEPKKIICLDYSYSLHLVKNKFNDSNIEYVVADVCDMPFKSGSFDIVISQGIMQHTRSPEKAFISQIRTLKSGGIFSIGNLYSPNSHNRKINSLRYKLNLHKKNREISKKYIKRSCRIYTLLANTGLYKIHKRFKFPFVLHYNNKPGQSFDYYYANALDYYMSMYRHLITSEEVKFWCDRLGVYFNKTLKGYKIIKN